MRTSSVLIVIAAMLWGTVGIATGLLYRLADTNPLSIGLWRLAISVPALALAAGRVGGRGAVRIARGDLGLMLLIGAGMATYQVGYFAAIERLGVTIAVLVAICTAPVMIAILAAVFLREPITSRVALALAGAVAGTVLLTAAESETGGAARADAWGLIFALGAALGYATVTLCSRALAGRYHPLQPIRVGFTAGALMLVPPALATGFVVDYPPFGWALLVYLGLVPTALAYWLFLRGIRATPATTASILALSEPLTSTALAALLFQERLSPISWLGAALLLAAMVALVTTRPASATA